MKDIILLAEKERAGFDRWERKAADASVKQIYGAERSGAGYQLHKPMYLNFFGVPLNKGKLPAANDDT